MSKQVDTRRQRGNVGRIRQRRELVTKVSTRHNRASHHRQIRVHSDCNAHESDTNRSRRTPGRTGTQRHNGRDDQRNKSQELRVNDL